MTGHRSGRCRSSAGPQAFRRSFTLPPASNHMNVGGGQGDSLSQRDHRDRRTRSAAVGVEVERMVMRGIVYIRVEPKLLCRIGRAGCIGHEKGARAENYAQKFWFDTNIN